ncbi:Predicted N-acetyltransferase YhbS [Yoonia tamlensis]|uniref:Predicted N-acetyltransferase YhbS n=1 Tax=Yoonia tamlensis TaxID=390270 RepID=A0A1I6HB26_9RHOB|nr:GNAT family N-acetyltransferase [Yoonia tamlensis]SFR51574.1 Predicted N-acetyltransferase YhbS [Yoonia tamlensis]
MDIEIVNEIDLSPAQDQEIAALLHEAFGAEFGGRSFFQQRHHLRLIARIDGKMAGHVALTYRVIGQGGKMIPILGLAEVATDKTYRGQGVARTLVTKSLDIASDSPAEFALLFGDPAHYHRYGFQAAVNSLRSLDLENGVSKGIKIGPDDSFMVVATGQTTWDPQAEVDLMGRKF